MASSVAPSIHDKLGALSRHLVELGSVIVCYSGGVDSAFLLAAALRADVRTIALTAASPSLLGSELAEAKRFAAAVGADHRVVESKEIEVEGYQRNATDRCFYCKTELYEIAERKRGEWGVDHVLNGTNVDDLGDVRPGLVAARQHRVRSPLVELGFTKADVREGARALGLELWDKPAAACLSSRIAYGTRVTRERLEMVGALESLLVELGFRGHRVRYHPAGPDGDKALARVELATEDIARAASPDVRGPLLRRAEELGFLFVTIDLAGYRMGSHNLSTSRSKRALHVL
jgi:pyridinium-3,5-biscarboxylic acid mononucleotide sulfurtransferase